ncbi:MAG TPA: (2Fe-2S)-binding protein [Phycisphaerales bacterium]|nr:(2Fe-2S)-binding protein [Phycisphaerales bacterium]
MAVVDRCVCHNITFAELKEIALRLGNDLERVTRETGCGEGCGMCLPYIRQMLATGETEFPVIRRPRPQGLNIVRSG